MRSQGSESAATTAETASGCGFTVMARRGIAPAASPSPELAHAKPTQRRLKACPRRRRCAAGLRDPMNPPRPLITQLLLPVCGVRAQDGRDSDARRLEEPHRGEAPFKAATRRVDTLIETPRTVRRRPRNHIGYGYCQCPPKVVIASPPSNAGTSGESEGITPCNRALGSPRKVYVRFATRPQPAVGRGLFIDQGV